MMIGGRLDKTPKRKMTLLQEKFVAAYIKNGGNGTQAYIEAGGSVKNARHAGSILLKSPWIKAALDGLKAEIRQAAVYDAAAAIAEGDKLIEEARRANQYSAVASLYQTKNKIAGNIREKFDIRHQHGFEIKIMGIEDQPRLVGEIDIEVPKLSEPEGEEKK